MTDRERQPPAATTAPPRPGGERPPGTVITFYSYKGGTGRSMSLANVAWILASAGNRVLVVDWDLEAPGLHRYFSPFLRDKRLIATEGVINFADEYRTKAMTPPAERETFPADWYLAHADLSHYAVRLEWDFGNGGYLDFVPAGQQDEDYSPLVNSFNWKTFFTDLGGNRLLDAAKEKLREDYDYILIDSRTGVSDTSGICTVKMPDTLVICFTLNNQSIEGAASVANSVFEQRGDGVKIFPVPMRLDNGELQKLEARSELARNQFFQFPNQLGAVTRKQYWLDVPVYYVTYYAYEEVLAAFGERDAKVVSMLASAERLTSYLTGGRVAKLHPPAEELRLKKLAEYEGREVEVTPAEKVSEAAQSAFRRFSEAEQEAARRLLLRLVRLPRSEEKELSRRRVLVSDLGAGASPLVRRLIDAQLIRLAGENEQGAASVELVNDELLRDWKELSKWIGTDREFLLWRQQHLRAGMAEWEEKGRTDDRLLDGPALDRARFWLKTRAADLNGDEVAFIKASIAATSRRRLKMAAAVAATVLIVSLGAYLLLSVWGSRKNRADAQRLAAEAERRVSAGLATPGLNNGDELQLGALLALESERLAHSEQATAALSRALAVLPRRVNSLKYDNDVMMAVWSPDGRYITTISGRATNVGVPAVVAKEDRVIEVREAAAGRRVTEPISFKSGVQNFSLSGDGHYLAFSRFASAGNNRPPYNIELLDVLRGEQTAIAVRPDPINQMIFSADSRLLITVGDETTAVLIDIGARKVLKKIRHEAAVIAAAFSPDAEFVATVSEDFNARVWRVSDREGAPPVRAINIGGVASKVFFTPDGRHLVTVLGGSGSTYAQIWNLEDGQETRFNHGSIIVDLAVSADGKYIATLGEEQAILVWDVAKSLGSLQSSGTAGDTNTSPPGTGSTTYLKQDALASLPTIRNVRKLAFGPGPANYLAVVGDSPVAFIWQLPKISVAALMTHDSSLNDIAFAPVGGMVATTSADASVRVWALGGEPTAKPCEHLTRNLSAAEWAQFLPDKSYQLTCPDITGASQAHLLPTRTGAAPTSPASTGSGTHPR